VLFQKKLLGKFTFENVINEMPSNNFAHQLRAVNRILPNESFEVTG